MSHHPDQPPFLRRTPPLFDSAGRLAEPLRRRLEEGLRLRRSEKPFLLLADRSEWDLAIVLDACRYDTFARINWLPGRLTRRLSPGSCTEEWLSACVEGPLDDVVYVSASPYVSAIYLEQAGLGRPFAHLEEVWRSGWDDRLHTVPPAAVVEAFRRVRPAWPGKKFVLHFMQPHHPFIGGTRLPKDGWRKYWGALEVEPAELEGKTVYELLEDGQADPAAALAAYEDNLRLVLGCVQRLLLEDSPGRTVVTSDHGDCFGEYGVFGHPPDLPLPELIEVPYLHIDPAG